MKIEYTTQSLTSGRRISKVLLVAAMAFLGGVCVVGQSRDALAQDRPLLSEVNDLVTERVLGYPVEGMTLHLTGAVGGGANLSSEHDGRGFVDATLDTYGLYVFDDSRLIQLNSYLHAPLDLSRAGDDGAALITGDDVTGQHHLWVNLGIDDPEEPAVSLSLEVDAVHGRDPVRRIDVGRQPSLDLSLSSTLWFTPSNEGDDGPTWVLPIRHTFHAIEYLNTSDAPPDQSSNELFSGLGLRVGPPMNSSYLGIVGISWRRTELDADAPNDRCVVVQPGVVVRCPGGTEGGQAVRVGQAERVTLRYLDIQPVFTVDGQVYIAGAFALEQSWVWDDQGTRGSLFGGSYGVSVRGVSDELEAGFGIVGARHVGTNAIGRVLGQGRLELMADFRLAEARIGFSHRSVFDWLTEADPDLETGSGDTSVPAMDIYTEWYADLVDPLEVGVYHRATYDFSEGALTGEESEHLRLWGQEVGIFLRAMTW